MPESKSLITKEQEKIILEITPSKYVKQRQGRGGKMLDYVETGYVIKRLNEIFNYLWSFDVVEEKQEGNQIMVKGKLTVILNKDISISKTQFGTYEIKQFTSGQSSPLGDAYKAASSDALKKCASLLGIAQDIFWGGETQEDESIPEKTGENGNTALYALSTPGQRILLKKLMDDGKVDKNYARLNTITFIEARELIQNNG